MNRMESLAPGLWRWKSAAGVNSYIWTHREGTVLIDPASDLAPATLAAAGIASPCCALATHVQAEHIDGAANFPGLPVLASMEEAYLCGGPAVLDALVQPWPPPWSWDDRGNYTGHVAGAINERPSSVPLERVEGIRPGRVCAGLTALSTPGHGKHALTWTGVLGDGRRVAFAGDLALYGGRLLNWFDCDWDYGLETGQKRLMESVRVLLAASPDILLPAHGDSIEDPGTDLGLLVSRLEKVLSRSDAPWETINFPDVDSPAPGFRRILPQLHQYRNGNCAILISRQNGAALLIDDGFCHWVDLEERTRHHHEVLRNAREALDISRYEIVIPTHYHGDHVENIPDLVATEGTRVVCLDVVADVLENPRGYNLACPLPWYGTYHDTVAVDQRVANGQIIRWHEYELEIFHLGGQTYHHLGVSVVIDGCRVIFSGDSLSGLNIETENILCFNDCEPEHRGWYYALREMKARDPDVIVAGHGVAAREPMPIIDAKLARWEQRLQQFRDLSGLQDLRPFFDPFLKPATQVWAG